MTCDAIVLCLSGTGLAVARALGRQGARVAAVDPRPWAPGHASRYVRSSRRLTVGAIRAFAGQGRPPLFACGDAELRWVMAHREELAGCVTLPTGLATGAAMLLLDKRQQYRRLSELGVRLPRTWIPTDGDAVAAAAAEARYPVVVKPAFGDAWRERLGGAKLLVCHGPAAVRVAAAAGDGTVIQEVIPGPETELRVMAVHMGSDGRPGPWVTARKLRQYPADYGSGSRVMACSDPELEEHTLALLTRLAIPGTFGAEWKRYRGQLWLVEINPRPVLWIGLAPAVVQDAWRELSGRSRDAPGPAVAAGRVWQYLLRDLLASRAAPGRLGDVLCEAARDDPLPGLIGPAAAAWQWASRRFGSAAGAAPGRDVSGPRRSAG